MRPAKTFLTALTALFGLSLSLGAAAANSRANSILGRVTDEAGGALPGVTVEARLIGSASARRASTDRAGTFAFPDCAAGAYRVSFRLGNFASVTRDLVLSSQGPVSLEIVMYLSATADIVVTGKKSFPNLADAADARESLFGVASSATEGTVSGGQLAERPILRPGEVLESVPGLIASQHSGEGKANQYFLRGFNLDHGTDFATTVAGVPVNMPSHAHGQGYADLNFLIPELISGIQYQKGPYAADQGDFSTAGSASIRYVNGLEKGIAKVGGGGAGYGRALFAQSLRVGEGTLLWALEAGHSNGPWVYPDNTRKYNGLLRYSQQNEEDAFSVTAMGYQNQWNSTDQVADRAVTSGRISRFGAIDPTDGGETHRYSLSVDWQHNGVDSVTHATAYAIDYGLKLFSNFTYYLDDPVHGDQFEQVDKRVVTGLKASQQWFSSWFGRETQNTVGIQLRNDNIAENGLFHTEARKLLGVVRRDHVLQTSGALFLENSLRWSQKVRTVIGLRGDHYRFHVRGDDPANSGEDRASLISPKLSVVLGPWERTEFYLNAGYGFHSNDARGATITRDPKTHESVERVTPLVRAKGAEVGLRSVLVPHLQTTLSFWGLDIGSELVFTGDAGTTQPSRPSRRTGIELASSWSPVSSLVFDADVAWSRARFTDFDPAGDHIPGAVETVVSAGAAAEGFSGFFGSLRLRYFGPRPLIEDNGVRSRSSTLVNAQIGYELIAGVRLAVDVFNVFDVRVSDIDYFYTSRLAGEPGSGIADIHSHPAEPRTGRLSISYSF